MHLLKEGLLTKNPLPKLLYLGNREYLADLVFGFVGPVSLLLGPAPFPIGLFLFLGSRKVGVFGALACCNASFYA